MSDKDNNRVYIYDTTLRDGAQTYGVDFSVEDKIAVFKKLDEFGVDYIEGGWPGANDTDTRFFQEIPKIKNARLCAFGMTKRKGMSVENDPSISMLLDSNAPVVTIVGKSWDWHITEAINSNIEENAQVIEQTISYIASRGREVMFDAEHFFDGYKANKECALQMISTAYKNGATTIVLCDTNGGTLPYEIAGIINEVAQIVPYSALSVHFHDDTGNAVANSLIAIQSGVRHIQGTINGLGERCGNANLTTLIPILKLKMGYELGVSDENLSKITSLSNFLYDLLNIHPKKNNPFVGSSAFAHKGGLHVSAILKNTISYEHIDPHLVGNDRKILISNQAGKSNIISRIQDLGMDIKKEDPRIDELLHKVKKLESEGYSFDMANASFAVMVARVFDLLPDFFTLISYRCINKKSYNISQAKAQEELSTEAIIKLKIGEEKIMVVAEGNGPVSAVSNAIKKALIAHYPQLQEIKLTDFKVRILNSEGTSSMIRTLIEYSDGEERWISVGVSTDMIEASGQALIDGILYFLLNVSKS